MTGVQTCALPICYFFPLACFCKYNNLDGKASTAEVKQVEDWYAQLDVPKREVSDERKLLIRAEILGYVRLAIAKKEIKKSFSARLLL